MSGPGRERERADSLRGLELRTEADVFSARRLARDAAAVLGLDTQGQVRFATALSEVARDALRVGGGRLEFYLDADGTFAVAFGTERRLPPEVPGVVAARRLVDQVEVADVPPAGSQVTLALRLVLSPGTPVQQRRRAVRQALDGVVASSPLDELRAQNDDLLAALEALRVKQQELIRLNEELDETNKGVVALYAELSAELENTNQGVVALYAELDERGAQLHQANEAKTRFLRSVSHELRTPVNSILGLAGLLLDPYAGLAGEPRTQVGLIRDSAGELLQRINQLLDVAKAESGRIEPVWADVELAPLLDTLRGRMQSLVSGQVRLVIEPPAAAVASVRTDAGLLRDVLHNLLGNAAKFTERGEIRLSVSADPAGQRLLISVRDTGVGIAAEQQDRIFEEFYQIPGPAQARTKGTGLGLPYARRVAQILGGGLAVTSEPGAGATFTLWLPYQVPAAARPIPLALVVEDDLAYRAVLQSWLRPHADRVLEAATVGQALALLRESVPTVILLDIGLPDADGGTLLAALASDARLGAVPVIVVSGSDLAGAELAAAAVLSKSELTGPLLGDLLAQVVPAS